MANRSIEVFTGGCYLCGEALKMVRELACENCDVQVHDLREGSATNESREKAARYGIHHVPAVVVEGKLVDCCVPQTPVSLEALRKAGVGQG